MHKIIAEKFEIDLSTVDITTTDENSMFLDKYTTKYSFPFSLELTNENQRNFQDLLDHCSKEITTEFDIVYIFGNIKEAGILRVDTFNETINCELQYGIEEFPNFNKKLNELELQKLTTTNVYAHAKTIIDKTWPEVNYNYPQIITDRYDTTQSTWAYFEKIFNNYKNGDFVTNEVVSDTQNNRNLMLPLPYKMHILTQGFEQAGYTLKGDVLTIETLKKEVLYADCDYNKILDQIDINTVILGTDRISSSGNKADYQTFVNLPSKGRYRVLGTAYIYGRWKKSSEVAIQYRGIRLFIAKKRERRHHSGYLYSYNVDFTFDTINDGQPDQLEIISSQFKKDDGQILDINTSSLFLYNSLGVAIPNIIQNNDVDLNRVVPDVTFGKFVTSIKNTYNLDLRLEGKDIYMDLVNSKINYEDAIDLSEFETFPERTYDKGISFLLKYQDANNEVNNHQKVFFDDDGIKTSGFSENDKTNTIEIESFPLKNEFKEGVQTAYAVESEKQKMYTVLYGGLNSDGLNLTEDVGPILIPNLVENYYNDWFRFRINGIGYKFTFNCYIEQIKSLSAKNKIFNFGRYFIIKTLIKRQVKKDLNEVEIDCFTLK